MPPRRPLVCTSLLLACLAAILVPARPAPAQGTSGSLPDPISARELSRYADRLALSDQQRPTVLEAWLMRRATMRPLPRPAAEPARLPRHFLFRSTAFDPIQSFLVMVLRPRKN